MRQVFTYEEVVRTFLPWENVIYSFVVQDTEGNITDFFSFYNLPSQILKSDKHTELRAAYCYYFVPKAHTVEQLMADALVIAKQENFDVFNCLDISNNAGFLENLKFGPGDGNLHYYLYNWRAEDLQTKDIGIILV